MKERKPVTKATRRPPKACGRLGDKDEEVLQICYIKMLMFLIKFSRGPLGY